MITQFTSPIHISLRFKSFLYLCTFFLLISCEKNTLESNPYPIDNLYRIPVVVHVIHQGEKIGEGYNLSEERIIDQIKTLNEDFRRKVGTRGFNNHPNGADTRIEFVLAKSTPNGTPTNGIVRIDSSIAIGIISTILIFGLILFQRHLLMLSLALQQALILTFQATIFSL